MSFDLFEPRTNSYLDTLPRTQAVEPGVFDKFAYGTGMATMKGFAKTARAIDLLGSVGPIMQDKITGGTEAQDKYFEEHKDVFQKAVDYWTPQPHEVGVAGEVVGGLLSTLPTVFASPSLAVGSNLLDVAEDLSKTGVSTPKAISVGVAQAIGLGTGIWLPILGNTASQRILLGGAGFNAVQGVVTRGISGEILEGTPAEGQFKAFDPTALTIDVLLGMAFGTMAHLNPEQRKQGAETWAKIEDWAKTLKPSDIDALATLKVAEHLNKDSMPGNPVDLNDIDAHVQRMREGLNQILQDDPVNLSDMPQPKFQADPVREVENQQRLAELQKSGEELRQELDLPTIATEAKAIGDRITGRLLELGMPEDQAKANGAVWDAFFRTAGQKYGVSPESLMQKYGPTIEKSVLAPEGALGQNLEQINTPEFRNWFGDSKVVDAEGKPLVVYHGTPKRDLEVFNTKDFGALLGKGAYFTSDRAEADQYSGNKAYGGPNTIPAYLSIRKPYEVTSTLDKVPSRTELEGQGYDGIILRKSDGSVRWGVAFDPTQIKSAIGNRGTFDPNDPNILRQGKKVYGFDQVETEPFKKWSNNAPLVRSNEAETYNFKTGQKIVVESYHGTQRPDRVGTAFKKNRATSGPMAFFTSNPELASGYAKGKSDTSLSMEDQNYANWFKFKPQGERSSIDIERAWYRLDAETKAKIAELAPQVRADDMNNVMLEPGNKSGNGSYDYNLQETQRGWDKRGNPLKALVEDWLNSGVLYGDEEKFMTVLKEVGFPVKDVAYDSPHAEYPFVYKTFIQMQHPLVTGEIPVETMAALEAAAKRDRSRAQLGGADNWDKATRTLREWVAYLKSDDGKYAWTSIPDKATKILKELGYDGIVDYSGKGGGHSSPVYIPFEESQVKSAIGNKGTFGDTSNILKQDSRGFLDQRTNLIGLFESADPSTFLHESGHFFLNVTRDMAMGQGAPDMAMKDWATLSNWLGIEGGEIPRAAHEKFAQGFEQYVMEGKAPNAELKGVFQQFRDWLIEIYRNVQSLLGDKLTDDVRGVMDRMLASQKAEPIRSESRPAKAEPPPPPGEAQPAGDSDPLKVTADRIATERGNETITIGQEADGTPITKTVREYLDDARADVEQAKQDVSLFEMAATCLLRAI